MTKVPKPWIDRIALQQLATALVLIAIIAFATGMFNKYCTCCGLPNWEWWNNLVADFYANITVDAAGVAFALAVIERVNKRREEQENNEKLMAQLIRELGSRDKGIAARALAELKAKGAHVDGTLQRANLEEANLEGVDLENTDLQGVRLTGANLNNVSLRKADLQYAKLDRADLRDADLFKAQLQQAVLVQADLTGASLVEADLQDVQFGLEYYDPDNGLRERALYVTLVRANRLAFAVLPDGETYDGRLNLAGDLNHARFIQFNRNDPLAMARYYKVSPEEYLAGQQWAAEHLTAVRRLAKLDPDPGTSKLPTEEATKNGGARKNHRRMKSSLVTHRVRRSG